MDEDAGRYAFWATMAGLALVPLAFLAGLLRSRLALANVGQLVVSLGQTARPGELRDAIARALADPSVKLAYWLPESESWVRIDGRRLPSLASGDGRSVATIVERNGKRVAAIVHDAYLLEDPELLDAVVAAAGLALENEQRLAALTQSEARMRGDHQRAAGSHVPHVPRRRVSRGQGRAHWRSGLASRSDDRPQREGHSPA